MTPKTYKYQYTFSVVIEAERHDQADEMVKEVYSECKDLITNHFHNGDVVLDGFTFTKFVEE